MLDRMLRYRIVCGIRSVDTQRALLHGKLTLQEAENTVLVPEVAGQGVRLMKMPDIKIVPELHKLVSERRPKSFWKNSEDRSEPLKPCGRCSSQEHPEVTCTFKNAKCFQCGRKRESGSKRRLPLWAIHIRRTTKHCLCSSLKQHPVIENKIVEPVQ